MASIESTHWEIQINNPFELKEEAPNNFQSKFWYEGKGKVYLLILDSEQVICWEVAEVGSTDSTQKGYDRVPDRNHMKTGKWYDLGKLAKVKKLDPKK